jgi:Tfp pilus assembly protein PilF
VSAAVTPLSDAEADAWLGDLLAQQGRTQEATARLQKALAADPNLALAHASLGTLKLRESNMTDARAYFEKAVSLGSANEFAHYAYAYGILSSGTVAPDEASTAARALERAIALRPGYTDAKLLLAYAYLTMNRAQAVRDLLTPVVKADPTNHQAALRLAEALLRLNELEAARQLLGPVVARSTDPEEKDRARKLLATSAGLQQRRDTLAAASAANGTAASPPAGQPPQDLSRVQYAFRAVGPNEQRVYGIFESIECSQNQFVVGVRTKDGIVRARAARFSDIQFIAYRKLASAQVSCGKQDAGYEIYLTWRESGPPAGDRTAIAVEVLPEGFIP